MHSACSMAGFGTWLNIRHSRGAVRRHQHLWKSGHHWGLTGTILRCSRANKQEPFRKQLHCAECWMAPKMLGRGWGFWFGGGVAGGVFHMWIAAASLGASLS